MCSDPLSSRDQKLLNLLINRLLNQLHVHGQPWVSITIIDTPTIELGTGTVILILFFLIIGALLMPSVVFSFVLRLLDFCICSFVVLLYCSIVLSTNANNLTFKSSSTISVRTVSHKVTSRGDLFSEYVFNGPFILFKILFL